jgi:hypothetical protein
VTKDEAIQAVRLRLNDVAEPFLWSKPEIISYLADAEEEAADRAKLIIDDTTPSLTKLTIKAGVSTYKLSERIVGVKRVWLESNGRDLGRTTEEDLSEDNPRWRTVSGRPSYFFEDELGRSLTVHAKPNADDVARLTVYRLPAEPLQNRECFEIPERTHVRMLDWALRMAYLKRDSQTFSQEEADRHEELFTASFGVRNDFNVQRKQRRHQPPVVRSEW